MRSEECTGDSESHPSANEMRKNQDMGRWFFPELASLFQVVHPFWWENPSYINYLKGIWILNSHLESECLPPTVDSLS